MRRQNGGRTMKSSQTPAAKGNHTGRPRLTSNSGEQARGGTAQVSARFPDLSLTKHYPFLLTELFKYIPIATEHQRSLLPIQ